MYKSYNQQLVAKREFLGLSLKEAAKEMGISFISLFFYERGYYRPSKKKLEKIEKVLGPIDFSGEKEYPQESLIVINTKSKSKKIRLITSGSIALMSVGLIITGSTMFAKSVTNTESYYGEVYNEARRVVIEKGDIGRDIVTDLEYSYIYNKDFKGRSDIVFYKTNSILYFNKSSYSLNSQLSELQELGLGRFHYQFGGSLATSSYICTFSYKSNDAGMFFSSDIYYENKPIEKITNLNIVVQGNIPITNELVVTLFNAKINEAMITISELFSKTLEKEVDFYHDFLKDRESGRNNIFKLQISGLAILLTSLISFFLSLAIFLFALISLIKHHKEEVEEDNIDNSLPKDYKFQFGIPDYILNWFLRTVSFTSMLVLLLSSFGGLVFSLPSLFSNETFLTVCKIGFVGGIYLRQIVTLTSNKKKYTLLKEIAKYILLYLTLATFETALMLIAETWGYNISNLIFKYVPRSILLASLLNCLIFYFLFFTPSFIKIRKPIFTIAWRLLSLIPLGMIVVISLVGNNYELFYGTGKNIYLIFWLSNINLTATIITVAFIYALFFIKLFFKNRYGNNKSETFFNGNRFNILINICYALIILICGLIDLIFKGNTIAYYLGIGNNIWILCFIPFVLFTKYGPNESEMFIEKGENDDNPPISKSQIS